MMSTCFVKVCYALLLLSLHTAGSIHGYNLATTCEDVKCIENERQSLLTFKQGLRDPCDMLSTWRDNHSNRDCCKWKGVECSNETGHVHMLRLRGTDTQFLSGDINITSLIELQNMEYLDLSNNIFKHNQILKQMSSFSNLRYLNLSYNNFDERIPYELGNLSQLEYLDLEFNSFSGAIPSQLGKLTHLRYLDLGLNDLYGAIPSQLGNLSMLRSLSLGYNSDFKINDAEWLSSLSSLTKLDLSGSFSVSYRHGMQMIKKLLPKLKELRLGNCRLSDNDILSFFDSHSNFSISLTILDLSSNMLTSSLFQSLSNFTFNLQQLYLSDNHIMSFPPSLNFPSLVILDLSNNNLISSVIFHWVLNFTTNLHTLSLSDNNLQGEIPAVLGNICTLRELHLSGNNFSGDMSSFIQKISWCNMHIIQTLDFSDNQITGLLPDLSILSSLRKLDLSNNRLIGEIPKSVGLLHKLESLYLNGNSFEGDITELHLTNLSNLETLDLSDNSLSLKFSKLWDAPFQLSILGIASCKLGPSFPSWLQTQRYLMFVDISNAGINDSVPVWFWNKLQFISVMNMSYNNLIGTIPNLPLKLPSFGNVYVLHSNQFEGRLPDFWLQAQVLDLSKNKISDLNAFLCGKITTANIRSLDLSDNQIRGRLSDCWGHLNSLEILDLSNNKLSGKIPLSMTTLVKLQILVLRNNSLFGELPSSLKNCTNLVMLDVGDNMLSGSIPSWNGESLQQLKILSLRENHFLGTLPSHLCYLSQIHVLDLSRNYLSGTIPRCLKTFIAMVDQNIVSFPISRGRLLSTKRIFSNVYEPNVLLLWKGHEYVFKNAEFLLHSIDLSSNHISGDMPIEFGQLLGLVSLNLSRNNLSGEIPYDIGNLNSLDFLDLSRNHFSGKIPATLAQIDRLSVLDLSNNCLYGKIPLGTQLQSFNSSSFEGNSNLCGKPLEKICPEDETPMKPQGPATTDDKDDNSVFYEGLYMSLGLGFFTGFWGLIGPLLLWRPWRNSYMRFLNKLTDYAYVMVAVNVARCQRWFNG